LQDIKADILIKEETIMNFSEFLHEELIIPKMKANSQEEVFKRLYELLLKNGYVKESFLEGIKKREQSFPTGLLLNKYNVALPHTDVEHVLKSAVAVATLSKPIVFKNMANPQQDVNVNIVFMIALNESGGQVKMLQQIVQLIQNDSLLEELMMAESGKEIIKVIKNISYEN
jgi:PTS system galactitol-specific IIA component